MDARGLLRRAATILVQVTAPGVTRGAHMTRYTMYRRIAEAVRPLRLSGRVLSISGSTHLIEVAGIEPTEVVDAPFPEYNVLQLPFADAEFDVVLSDQVLEHVGGNPQRAVDECFRVLKPGGVVIHTTAFMMALHGSPHDYWRFSPDGLRLLCASAREVIECGGWGNPFVMPAQVLGFSRIGVPDAAWHPLHILATRSRASYHHVVWIVARK